MKPLDRNIGALEHIVVYCQQIEQTVERFGNSAETFQNDPIFLLLTFLLPLGSLAHFFLLRPVELDSAAHFPFSSFYFSRFLGLSRTFFS